MKIHEPSEWYLLTLEGADAGDFLQRLSTASIQDLKNGQGARACFLGPRGKIKAYFTVWKDSQDLFVIEGEAGANRQWQKRLLEFIDFYTFGENFTLRILDDQKPLWIFPEEGEPLPAPLSELEEEFSCIVHQPTGQNPIRFCSHGTLDFGRPLFSVWAVAGALQLRTQKTEPLSSEELKKWRIQNSRPALDREITEDVLPLEVGLAPAVKRGKGCYPGQEVIERIFAYGAPARRLVQIEGAGTAPLEGEALHLAQGPSSEIGKITSATSTGEKFIALAYIKKLHAQKGIHVRCQSGAEGEIKNVVPYQ